jgi:NAD(P)-dependent dehydrogenase (short-subunit alcohol dehydrogenase family)
MFAQELDGTSKVRINSVNPGRMRTNMRAAAYPAEDPNSLPTPESVTPAFLYLLSGESRGTSGGYFEAQ